jgi:transcription antitermination protein NusB
MATGRHTLRAIVMQTLFAWEFRGGEVEAILFYNIVNGARHIEDTHFAYNLLKNTLNHRKEIKELIKEYAPDWPFEKIAPVDRAILELGLCELMFDEKIPDLVAINEAVELAKEFGVENSSKFINGVLSSVYEAHRGGSQDADAQTADADD